MIRRLSRLDVFLIIFKNPIYIASTLLSALLFYSIFYYLIEISNKGVFLLLISPYLVYLLVATSGVVFSISLYILARSLLTRAAGIEGGVAGLLVPSVGGLIASCGCSFSIFASILIFFGLNTFDAVGLVSAINSYQIWLFLALIAANLVLIYFYLGKLTKFFRKSTGKVAAT